MYAFLHHINTVLTLMIWKLLHFKTWSSFFRIKLAELIMTEDEIEVPSNADEGLVLYRHLRSLLDQ